MKTLIIYGSRKGFAQFCAGQLAEKLEGRAISAGKAGAECLADVDLLIIGSSIRMGKITRDLRRFIHKNREALMQKKLGLFICSGDTDRDYGVENFPGELRNHASLIDNFGGRLKLEDYDPVLRWVLKRKAGVSENYDSYRPGVLNAFAEALKGEGKNG